MVQVGIRELKARLSAYVATARAGDRVVITDRGKTVAQIVPIGGEAALQSLIDDGLATPPAHRNRPLPRPRSVAGPVSDLVGEQRE